MSANAKTESKEAEAIQMQALKKDLEASRSEIKPPDAWYGARHTQILLIFALVVIAYGMRVNLSVGIVAMTDPSANPDYTFPTYHWEDKSIILSSFFWGYVIPQVGAGQLAKKYGPRWFLTGTMAVCSIFTLVLPLMASLGSWGVMICRIVQGFCQGFIFPSVHNLLSKWAPLPERSRLGTFVYAGGPFGTVVAMPLTGWICGSSIGWPSVFYIYGSLGLIWVVIFGVWGSNSPAEHATIDTEEKYYIEATLGHDEHFEVESTPWKDIWTSLPVWAILMAHCGQNWGFWTLLTEIPTYMGAVLNFNIKDNGLLSALPYFTLWVLSFAFGGVSDYLVTRNHLSIAAARKIANSIGILIPAVALVALGFVEEGHQNLAIGLLIVAVGINSAAYCGFQVNHIDLSPKHAGTLMGITNGISNICSIIAPLIVQFIVTDEKDTHQWRIVFFLAAAIYVFSDVFFVAFGSGKIQYWDTKKPQSEKKTDP